MAVTAVIAQIVYGVQVEVRAACGIIGKMPTGSIVCLIHACARVAITSSPHSFDVASAWPVSISMPHATQILVPMGRVFRHLGHCARGPVAKGERTIDGATGVVAGDAGACRS